MTKQSRNQPQTASVHDYNRQVRESSEPALVQRETKSSAQKVFLSAAYFQAS